MSSKCRINEIDRFGELMKLIDFSFLVLQNVVTIKRKKAEFLSCIHSTLDRFSCRLRNPSDTSGREVGIWFRCGNCTICERVVHNATYRFEENQEPNYTVVTV